MYTCTRLFLLGVIFTLQQLQNVLSHLEFIKTTHSSIQRSINQVSEVKAINKFPCMYKSIYLLCSFDTHVVILGGIFYDNWGRVRDPGNAVCVVLCCLVVLSCFSLLFNTVYI